MKVAFVFLVFLLYTKLEARYYPQIVDFLCGCEYCETVSRSEPLIIGEHMLRCHSWRDSMKKTIEIMNQSKPNPFDIPARDLLPKENKEKNKEIKVEKVKEKEPIMNVVDDPYSEYEWRFVPEHGWTYSTLEQVSPLTSTWIYREDLGWVYSFNFAPSFLYSAEYGWLYTQVYRGRRLIYWYDRRMWILASQFKKEYQESEALR